MQSAMRDTAIGILGTENHESHHLYVGTVFDVFP